MKFGWDEGKQLWLLDDRKIDFEDMKALFDGRPRLTYPSPRHDEERLISVGEVGPRFFSVVWMWRGATIWMITARRAWKSEERQFLEMLKDEEGRGDE